MDTQTRTEELDLPGMLRILADSRWLILTITVLCTVGAGIAAFLTPKTYEASIVISPASTTSSTGGLGSLGGLASQFSGVAALAGITLSGDTKKAEFVAVLQSEALTERYITEHNLLPVLFAADWDSRTHTWRHTDPQKMPTLWKANQRFDKSIRSVSTNTKSGLVTMSIDWRDPKVAAQWANGLVNEANDYLRTKAIEESERNIAYLNDQAAKTNIVEVRQAIYTIMQSEMHKAMLARGSLEYAFKIIDPAVPPEKAVSPKKTLWVIAGFLVGFLLSANIAYLRSSSAGFRLRT